MVLPSGLDRAVPAKLVLQRRVRRAPERVAVRAVVVLAVDDLVGFIAAVDVRDLDHPRRAVGDLQLAADSTANRSRHVLIAGCGALVDAACFAPRAERWRWESRYTGPTRRRD